MKRSFDDVNQSSSCPEIMKNLTSKVKALNILRKCPSTPFIAVDLDYTVWKANCFEHTVPPYIRSPESKINPSFVGGTDRIICRDKRNNLPRILLLYPEVVDIFEWCVDNGIILTICSRCPEQGVVKAILDALEMWEWFLLPQIYASKKTHHFRALKQSIGCKYSDFLFFDDDVNNINMCGKSGVNCVHVDKFTGLDWKTFISGLELFQTRQHAKMLMYSSPIYNSNSNSNIKEPSSSCSSVNENSFSTVESIDSVNGESTGEEPGDSFFSIDVPLINSLMALSRQPSQEE